MFFVWLFLRTKNWLFLLFLLFFSLFFVSLDFLLYFHQKILVFSSSYALLACQCSQYFFWEQSGTIFSSGHSSYPVSWHPTPPLLNSRPHMGVHCHPSQPVLLPACLQSSDLLEAGHSSYRGDVTVSTINSFSSWQFAPACTVNGEKKLMI